MKRRHLLQAAAAGAVAGTFGPAGAAESIDETWTDPARNRDVLLRLRWPQGGAACGLIVHSHGLGGSRDGGDVWGDAWRVAGFAVAHVQHAGSDTEALRGGVRALRGAATAEQLLARVADMRFVIDEVERRQRAAHGPWPRVRLDAIGASGHSFGAQTVQALAGKRFPARAPDVTEMRYRAFVAFSPSPGRGDRQSMQQQFGAITRPCLLVTGSLDGDPLPGLGGSSISAQMRAGVYDGLPSGNRALLLLDGADHMTFAGNAEQRLRASRGPLRREPIAAELESAHHALVARITTLWWRARLLGDAAALAALQQPAGLGAQDRWRMD
jgi:predicted dienelactone hydrolase